MTPDDVQVITYLLHLIAVEMGLLLLGMAFVIGYIWVRGKV